MYYEKSFNVIMPTCTQGIVTPGNGFVLLSQIVLHLNMPKINCLRLEFELDFLLPNTDGYSAGSGVCRDPHTLELDVMDERLC